MDPRDLLLDVSSRYSLMAATVPSIGRNLRRFKSALAWLDILA
jgi:hypothetical protein